MSHSQRESCAAKFGVSVRIGGAPKAMQIFGPFSETEANDEAKRRHEKYKTEGDYVWEVIPWRGSISPE